MKDKIKGWFITFELVLLIFVSIFALSQHINYIDSEFFSNISNNFIITSKQPIFEISSDVVSGKAPLTVSFSLDMIEDENWKVKSYNWNFGDGHFSSDKNPTHKYQKYGFYIIYLNITFTNGQEVQRKLEIDVLKNKYPQATAWVTGTSSGAPTRVYFHGRGIDIDGTIVSYKWSGAVKGDTPEVSRYFSWGGHYKATFTVTDDNGDSDSATVSFWLDERWEREIVSMVLKPIHRFFNR